MSDILYQKYTSTSTSFHQDEKAINQVYQHIYQTYIQPYLPSIDKDSVKILDIGCGWGGLLKVLQQKGYSQATGFDISPEQVETAIARGVKNITSQSIEDFLSHTKPEQYDRIILFDVLEHFPSDAGVELMQKIRTLLKPQGKILIQVPNGASLILINYYNDITHYKAFTPTSLTQIAKMSGFQHSIHQEVLPYLPFKKKVLSRVLWYGIIKPLSRLYMLAAVGNSGGKIYTPNILSIWTKE
jgi:2-polyprenyl-3-methyl-5-hydroxy-6-metoxy-1,4-benzoquinol methylase